MQDSTRKLIEENDKKLNRAYRMLDFFNCEFKVIGDKISVKINDFSLNGIDLNCDQENIFSGPFYIKFNDYLDIFEDTQITECEWNNDDTILKINDKELRYIDTDLVYFINDFNGEEKQAINNVLEKFCDWVKRNYV